MYYFHVIPLEIQHTQDSRKTQHIFNWWSLHVHLLSSTFQIVLKCSFSCTGATRTVRYKMEKVAKRKFYRELLFQRISRLT
jgi:hypothetical protein